MNNEDKNKKVNLEFQLQETETLIEGLEALRNEAYKSCKWEMQESGHYYYTPNKKVKQIEFTIKSIKRQLNLQLTINN